MIKKRRIVILTLALHATMTAALERSFGPNPPVTELAIAP
jgi:hypothetical protein